MSRYINKNHFNIVEELPKNHPTYAKISLANVNSTGHALVGSDIIHQRFITLRISTASFQRKLYDDTYFADQKLIEISLSPVQWAQLVSSFNTEGVPATLEFFNGQSIKETAPFVDKTAKFSQEFKDNFNETLENIYSNIIRAIDGLDKDAKMGKKEMRELLRTTSYLVQNISANSRFAASQFNENLESRINEAKVAIEGLIKERLAEQRDITAKAISTLDQALLIEGEVANDTN